MLFARVYLWVGVVSSLLFGGIYLINPELMAGPMGIEAVTPAGLTDLRATYGGFQLGMGGFLAWCLREPGRYGAGLIGFAFVVGGLGICRAIGLMFDGLSLQMAAAVLIEWTMCGISLFAVSRLEVRRPASPS